MKKLFSKKAERLSFYRCDNLPLLGVFGTENTSSAQHILPELLALATNSVQSDFNVSPPQPRAYLQTDPD
jgi:hypothetical protein